MAHLLSDPTSLLHCSSDIFVELLGDSKLTSKFQATVPKRVRDLLKLSNGDRLVFARVDGQIVVKKGRIKVEA